MGRLTVTVTCTECRRAMAFSAWDVADLDANMIKAGWRYTGHNAGICPDCDKRMEEEYQSSYDY